MSETRNEILKQLIIHKGEYVSGQMLSDAIGCSRTAVWKQVKELIHGGYEIESVNRKGYRLLSSSGQLTVTEIQTGLNTQTLGARIHLYDQLPSTQKKAHYFAEEGAEEGTIVIAEEQTQGRGRLGRAWHSPKGTGIWMSTMLRPDIKPRQAPQLTLLTAVALVKAIKKAVGIECQIKWPNDILYKGKKLVGILTELQTETDSIRAVLVGTGLNVNQSMEDIPENLHDVATSLKIIKGEEVDRTRLIQCILEAFESLYLTYLQEGFNIIRLMWESYALTIGQFLTAQATNGETVTGIAQGIDEAGLLLLKDEQGTQYRVLSANIRSV